MAKHIYEIVSEAVAAEGVTTVFGLMGDGNMKLVNHMTLHEELRFVSCRHEATAVSAADAYARVSGQVGVVTTTQGPGVTNTLTALLTAARAASPVVFLAAATRPGAVGAMQDLDQVKLIESLNITCRPLDPADPAGTIQRAFSEAAELQRPIVVNMPLNIQDAVLDVEPPRKASEQRDRPHRTAPDLAAVMVAADYLLGSQRPMFLAGRGAMKARAGAGLTALAESVGAILATSLAANGMFSGSSRNVGVCGGLRSMAAEPLIESADCVLVFGASLNALTTHHGAMLRGARKVVQVDTDPEAIGRLHPVDLGIVGDAGEVADALLKEVKSRKASVAGFDPVLFPLAREKTTPVSHTADHGSGVDPVALMARLNEMLPAERTVVSDGGHSMGFSAILFDVMEGVGYLSPVDFGSIGLGLGAAIGAACGRPERRTILTMGDGALLMNLGDLDTAVRHGLPLVIVVLDDAAYGAELHHLAVDGGPTHETVFATVDFAGTAQGLGCNVIQVRSMSDVEKVAQAIDDTRRPLLIDCKIDRGVRARWFEEMWSGPRPAEPRS